MLKANDPVAVWPVGENNIHILLSLQKALLKPTEIHQSAYSIHFNVTKGRRFQMDYWHVVDQPESFGS